MAKDACVYCKGTAAHAPGCDIGLWDGTRVHPNGPQCDSPACVICAAESAAHDEATAERDADTREDDRATERCDRPQVSR